MSKVMMATARILAPKLIPLAPIADHAVLRCLSTTSILTKNIKAGVPKSTPKRNRPLTYEEAQKPHHIGVRKAWNSWNTSNLQGLTAHTAQTTFEDVFIRKFVTGTWATMFVSEVIIKRRQNMVIISGLVSLFRMAPSKVYFLIGYTEEMLSLILKRPVKMEIQTVNNKKDVEFKYI